MYRVIEEQTIKELVKQVTFWMASGWIPAGGVCFVEDKYLQAMYQQIF